MCEKCNCAASQQAAEPMAWKVGNLLSVTMDEYPGMGGLFAQVWDGDTLIARVYGDSAEEVRERSALVASRAAPPQQVEVDSQAQHRSMIIGQAVMHHGGKWPEQLSSGIMFFNGQRITVEEFQARAALLKGAE